MVKEKTFLSAQGAFRGQKHAIEFTVGLGDWSSEFKLTVAEVEELVQLIAREYLQIKRRDSLDFISHTPKGGGTWLDKLVGGEKSEHGGQGMAD